jgi:hypothetical protein
MVPEAAVTNMGESNTNPTTDDKAPADQQSQPIALADALAKLTVILPRLADALAKSESRHRIEPLALRIDELAKALSVSRRALERELAAKRFPGPDLHIGRMPLWRVESVTAWLARGRR